MILSKLPSMDLQNANSSYTIMVFQHSTVCDQGTHFTVYKYGNGPMLLECGGLTMFPHHPEAAGLREHWNGLLKIQL